MKQVSKRRLGKPTLSEVGEIAVQMFESTVEKRKRRFDYSEKCQEFQERNGLDHINSFDEKFREYTRDSFEDLEKAKSNEYNAYRRLERACIAFLK